MWIVVKTRIWTRQDYSPYTNSGKYFHGSRSIGLTFMYIFRCMGLCTEWFLVSVLLSRSVKKVFAIASKKMCHVWKSASVNAHSICLILRFAYSENKFEECVSCTSQCWKTYKLWESDSSFDYSIFAWIAKGFISVNQLSNSTIIPVSMKTKSSIFVQFLCRQS